jgi:hypothetical protein
MQRLNVSVLKCSNCFNSAPCRTLDYQRLVDEGLCIKIKKREEDSRRFQLPEDSSFAESSDDDEEFITKIDFS